MIRYVQEKETIMSYFEIQNDILLEERDEVLLQELAEKHQTNGFLLFRPKVVEKFANGDCMVDAILAIIDHKEDGTAYAFAKPGLFICDKNNMVFGKMKEEKNTTIVKLYETPFLLNDASTNMQTVKLNRETSYQKNLNISQIAGLQHKKIEEKLF